MPAFLFRQLHAEYLSHYLHHEFNLPFSQEGYTQLGRLIARWVLASFQPSCFKLIALDCDNTLWAEKCASLDTISVSSEHLSFHEFLLR